MFNLLRLTILGLLLLSPSCGSKEPEQIQLKLTSSDQAFSTTGLKDLVFQVQQSNSTDVVVFPAACAATPALSAECGFNINSGAQLQLELSNFEKGVSLTVVVCGRDDTGTTLISGTSKTFKNQPATQTITIDVSQGVGNCNP